MKKRFLFSLVLFSVFVLALGLFAEMSFRVDPVISDGSHDECTKYIDVVTGAERWSGTQVAVVVAGKMDGLGQGQGTLKNVTILGKTYATYQDKPEDVGTKNDYGQWTAGSDKSVGAAKYADVPTNRVGTYSWSSGGEITLRPSVWKESISIGGRINIPIGVSGTFSTSGTWDFGTSTTRSAARASGTHTVSFKYKCSSCNQIGDSAAAIGGREAHIDGECPGSDCSVRYRKCLTPAGHKIIVCPGSGCSVEYRECSPPAGHRPCPSCGARECEVSDEASSGCSVCPNRPTSPGSDITYACGVHSGPESDSASHALQASCSVTNSNGQSCTVSSFYACQSHTHTYPNARFLPLLTVRQRCQSASLGYTCSKGGYTTGRDTHTSTCPLWHRYWDCHPASVEKHKVRTCVRCSNTYQNCDGGRNPCISGLGHTETVETTAEVPSPPQPDPSPPSETPPTTSPEDSDTDENEEQETEEEDTTEVPEETTPARPTAVCGSGHTYFTDGLYARNRHRDRTCLRCSQTYQKCSNYSSACQNTHWHTENTEASMTGGCGHTYRIRVRAQHASVTCSVQNSAGDTCSGGSYYVCQSHTHTYPSRSTPTPTPSPPENSNPNNNEDEEEEEEAEVPAAPPAPVISYHPCGIHLTTVSGDHSLQASCSTDRTCIATSFYRCQHSSHTYPAPPPAPAPTPTPTVVCPADSWTNCGGTSSHAQTCRSGHTYYTCGTAEAHHKDRTCTRCSETYTKCSHTATSCGGTRWHTQESDPYIRGACGHQYPRSKADRHTTIYACKREGCSERLTHCQNGPEKCVRPNRPRKSHWL